MEKSIKVRLIEAWEAQIKGDVQSDEINGNE